MIFEYWVQLSLLHIPLAGKRIFSDILVNFPISVYGCISRDFGCELAGPNAIVRLLITTVPSNAKLLEPDLHCTF